MEETRLNESYSPLVILAWDGSAYCLPEFAFVCLPIMRTKRYVVLRNVRNAKPALEFPRLLASLQVRVSGSLAGSSILPIFTCVVTIHSGANPVQKGEL